MHHCLQPPIFTSLSLPHTAILRCVRGVIIFSSLALINVVIGTSCFDNGKHDVDRVEHES